MAIVAATSITPEGPAAVTVAFDGSDRYIYLDGELAAGPATTSAVIPAAPDSVFALEIHDVDPVIPIYAAPLVHPTIIWSAVSGAVQYRIYHTPPSGSESLIHTQEADETAQVYQITCPVACSTGWQLFRVETVDEYNRESTTDSWAEHVDALPPAPASLSLAGTGGTFTLTVTP